MADSTMQRLGIDIAKILNLAELVGGTEYGAANGLNPADVAAKARNALDDALRLVPEGLRDNVAAVAQGITEKATIHAQANHIAGLKAISVDGLDPSVEKGSRILSHLVSFVRTPRMPKNLFLETKEAENLASLAEQHGYQGAQESLKGFTGGVRTPQSLFEEASIGASQTGRAATQAASATDAAKQQVEGIKGALGNFFSGLGGMSNINKAALGVSAAAAVHGASGIVQRDGEGKRRIRFDKVFQVGVAIGAAALTVYGHKQGGNTLDGGIAAGKQVVGKFTEMLASRGAPNMSQTRS